MLDLALSHIARGLPVFPCRREDKRPLTSNGFKGATCNERIIRVWGERHPDALVAMPTGQRTGVWVLDVDPRHGGDASLASLPALPSTRTVRTRGGGRHFYFKCAGLGNSPGRLPPGIDVRGNGGYVLVAGNPGYELEADAELVEAPDWLLEIIRPRPYHPQPRAPYQPQAHDRYVAAAVARELDALAATSIQRGYALNRAGFVLGTFVGAGALSREEAEHGLFDAAARNGVLAVDGEREVRLKIKRGLDVGISQPRQLPERREEPLPRWVERFVARARAKEEAV
jgi:hypothetical protein